MSYQFGFGWSKSDPNDLCLREERFAGEFSHLKKAVSNPGAFVLPFSVDSEYANHFDDLKCFHFNGDFEQISVQMASRFLLQYPDCTAFPFSSFPVLYTDAKPSILSLIKNKLNLSLSVAASEDGVGGANECLHHCIMFSAFDCLLKQGFQSFATDDQLRGVVARFVDNNTMEVCSLRNCVLNDSGRAVSIYFFWLFYDQRHSNVFCTGQGQINIEVAQYKCSPLRIDEILLRQPNTPRDVPGPVWRAVGELPFETLLCFSSALFCLFDRIPDAVRVSAYERGGATASCCDVQRRARCQFCHYHIHQQKQQHPAQDQ